MDNRIIELISEEIRELRKANLINDKKAEAAMQEARAAKEESRAAWNQSVKTQAFLEVVIHNQQRAWFEKLLGLNRYAKS